MVGFGNGQGGGGRRRRLSVPSTSLSHAHPHSVSLSKRLWHSLLGSQKPLVSWAKGRLGPGNQHLRAQSYAGTHTMSVPFLMVPAQLTFVHLEVFRPVEGGPCQKDRLCRIWMTLLGWAFWAVAPCPVSGLDTHPSPNPPVPLCENARHVPSKGTTLACHLPLPRYWVHPPPAVARTSHW